jgi:dipeptidase
MCDTVLAAPDVTAEAVMLFGKNSDRQRNEAHLLEVVAGGEHAAGERVRCTYIAVPQARRTFTALFCRPFWTWGPEMGVNEHGVAIGNEAVYTRGPPPETPALIGMDLAGLALQRAASAAEAVEVITGLLAEFGQGGDCGHLTPAFYNNSYIVADAGEAWVLETAGREWLAERVAGGVRTISNIYGIARPDRRSAGLDGLIAGAGWPDPAGGYAAALADPEREHLGQARVRQAQSQARIAADAGAVDAATLMAALREHGSANAGWTPATAATRSVCMHAAGEDRGGQTTGSMVSELRAGTQVHWVTGTAAPCLSVFKPVFLDLPLPAHGPPPRGEDDPATLWWRHERLHRAALRGDYAAALAQIAPERDRLEAEFREAVAGVRDADRAARAAVVETCWRHAEAAEARWLSAPSRAGSPPAAYVETWGAFDRLAGLG